ncbi:MFS transporter [Lactovum miscens]|uniref:EmrB/QacA subfamily drug resistance transporter n=1 Tax=Lactovum miscens TaxID=190387 RepID=A0A841C085_9LACT|nr:MFS transporter [Lactovum miscens]MBB5887306.1 EmrB/QacA subfamily drug resistance transporter [Lactovum miscens]
MGNLRKGKLYILVAIFIATFMTSVEVTIVSTAMPTIISELHGLELQSWVFAIYLLATAITTPFYGKLSDNIGRKSLFMFGLLLFLIGSFLCGFAPNMVLLITFRVIQGIGAGSVMPLTFTIIADLWDHEQRAKILAMTNTAWAISALLGPLLGGWIVDTLGWHWVFFINVPLGILTILLTAFGYKDVYQGEGFKKLDYSGIITLSLSLISLLLIFQELSANEISWVIEVVYLLIFIISSALFFRIEKKSKDPIIDFKLFGSRFFMVQILLTMLLSGILISFNIYFPIWLQSIYRVPATIAGLALTPSSIMWMVVGFFVGFLMDKFKAKQLYAGLIVLMFLFVFPLVIANNHFPIYAFYVISGIIGVVMGIILTVVTLLIQKSVTEEMVGQASSMVVLARTLGQAMMTGIFGLVFTLGINAELHHFPRVSFESVNKFISSTSSSEISEAIRPSLNQIILGAIHQVFLLATILCIFAFIINLLSPNEEKI